LLIRHEDETSDLGWVQRDRGDVGMGYGAREWWFEFCVSHDGSSDMLWIFTPLRHRRGLNFFRVRLERGPSLAIEAGALGGSQSIAAI
jgi:hypothetical protein